MNPSENDEETEISGSANDIMADLAFIAEGKPTHGRLYASS